MTTAQMNREHYAMPDAPRAISGVNAAWGPYAAELSASRPKPGIPLAVPSLSVRSSEERSGRPKRKSITDIVSAHLPRSGISLHENRTEIHLAQETGLDFETNVLIDLALESAVSLTHYPHLPGTTPFV